jgi:hypothetical protein
VNNLTEQGREPEPSLDFCDPKKKERIHRQTTAIITTGYAYPMVQKRRLLSEAMTAAQEQARELTFLNKGEFSVLRTAEEIFEMSHALALFHFSREHHYIADMFSGLYAMATRGEKFRGVKLVYARDLSVGKETLTAIRIATTKETLYKAALGPLVDDNAEPMHGAYEIVRKAKEVIDPIIYGARPTPQAVVSLKGAPLNGKKTDMWVRGEPLHFYKTTGGLAGLVVVDLDCFFAPVKIEGDKIRADDQFISTISGLTAMLQLGKQYRDDKDKTGRHGVNCNTAKRIILAVQMGIEARCIAGLRVRQDNAGKMNVTVKRKELVNIVPEAIQDLGKRTERPNYQEVSNAVSKAGQYLYEAIEKTKMRDYLDTRKIPIYIPAIDGSVEFPKEAPYKGFVHFKVDKI